MESVDWLNVLVCVIASTITANVVAYGWYIRYIDKVLKMNEEWMQQVKEVTAKTIKGRV